MPRLKSFKLAICSGLFCAFFWSAGAHADLIARDSSLGASSITFDSATNLEWLDLTQTMGMSFDDFSSATGDQLRELGFRIGMRSEVRQLFSDSGFIVSINGPAGFNDVAAARSLMNLVGFTSFTNGPLGNVYRSIGLLKSDTVETTSLGRGFIFLRESGISSITNAILDQDSTIVAGFFPSSYQSNDTSLWLVREPPVLHPVLEPEIYAMLSVGLGLMGWVKRRKKPQTGIKGVRLELNHATMRKCPAAPASISTESPYTSCNAATTASRASLPKTITRATCTG